MKHKETLPEQVQAFLQEQQMVQAGDTICCALSGGADSVCLLRCLLELAEPHHHRCARQSPVARSGE